jgi:Na+-driven multidrug efflux pump
MRAVGIPFSLTSTALGGAFRGRLDTRTPLYVAIGANAVNLALDPLLIFGLGPFSAFGAPGAAAATVAAELIGAAALASQLRKTALWPQVRVRVPVFKYFMLVHWMRSHWNVMHVL